MRTPVVAGLLLTAAVVALEAAPSLTRIAASDNALLTGFGRSVAIAGDVAFVGEPTQGAAGRGGGGGGARGAAAPQPAPDPATAGIVHVYRRGPTGWKETETISAPEKVGRDGFGSVVATDGATLLVARYGQPDNNTGAVFVYRKGADGKWAANGQLPARPADGATFGTSMVVAGEWAAVGAPIGETGGTVYLFRRAANGSWAAAGMLNAPTGSANDRFGTAVALDGSRLAVGAPGRDLKGRVFLFTIGKDGATTPEGDVISRAIPDNSLLGSAIALKGDRLIVGGPAANFATVNAAPAGRGGRGAPSFDSLVGVAADRARKGTFAADSATISAALRASALRAGAAQAVIPSNVAVSPCAGGAGGRGGAGGATTPGVAVSFARNPVTGAWTEKGVLTPFDVGNGCFGSAIAFTGDEIWIGAPTSGGMGRIYRAKQEKDGSWSTMNKLMVESIDANAQFGAAFAVTPTVAVVGMPGDGANSGAVTFLNRTATAPTWTLAATVAPVVIDPIAQVKGKEAMCEGGKVSAFSCNNTSLLAYMPLSKIGAKPGVRLSGMWGWTDPLTGRDYALLGRTDGTAFVDVTDPSNPRYLGDMLRTEGAQATSWRELKTYKNFALVVSDASGSVHGVQFFDLTRLRAVKGAPQRFEADAHYPLGSIHNIVVNEESGFAYAVGTASGGETCGGGLHMIDIHNPLKPTFAGCVADSLTGRSKTGYTHDAQCVMYRGPDKRYTGHEVCIAANETMLSLQDVTDKKHPKVISRVSYPNVAYAHQGWFTTDQRYWYLNDELDESGGRGLAAEGSRTLIWDFQDLEQPVLAKEFVGATKATDHNLYVKGDRMYQSNYMAGLRILDVSDPVNIHEVGSLQTTTAATITSSMSGSWSNYPFFKNGAIGVVSMGEGFFLVKDRTRITP